jgi:predicted DNA repair protein MutK
LPVVWAVAVGSLKNKVALVPAALAISALAPWLITPLLMVGGAFLCYEGFEKAAHKLLHLGAKDKEHHREEIAKVLLDPDADLVELEKDKIKGAIRTDFVLSAEIIVIALGSAAGSPFVSQVGMMVLIALLMTGGVYGLVASIVKLDDIGLHLSRRSGAARTAGRGILMAAPWLMKALGAAGTAAMFLVGGGILTHGIPPLHHAGEYLAAFFTRLPGAGGILGGLTPMVFDGLSGVAAGALANGVVLLRKRVL